MIMYNKVLLLLNTKYLILYTSKKSEKHYEKKELEEHLGGEF